MRPHNQPDHVMMKTYDEESQIQVIESLTSYYDQKLDKLSGRPSQPYAACIYRVTPKLRKSKESAYTPRIVSIGPLYRDLVHVQGMESTKLKFLQNFVIRFGISPHTLVKFAAKEESFVRGCYEGTVSLSPKRLTEAIMLDGVFVVELLLEKYFAELRDPKEMIFEDTLKHNDLLHDMMLLENQLPISILTSLLKFVDFSFLNDGVELTIYDLAYKFFEDVGATRMVPLTGPPNQARHFVEFLQLLHATRRDRVPTPPPSCDDSKKVREQPSRLGKLLMYFGVPKQPSRLRKQPSTARVRKLLPCCCGMGRRVVRKEASAVTKFENTRSATELQEAGVRFCSGEGNCLLVVDFVQGVLTIPKFTVNASTETFFRNLIAFEHTGHSKIITSYVVLMDGFINTCSDVDLLDKHGIIKNNLGDSQDVADLFNNIHKEVVTEVNEFYFAVLCEELNDYSKNRFHQLRASCFRWRVMLWRDYFSNPWSCISLFAAILLLVLTIVQTVCSILQV